MSAMAAFGIFFDQTAAVTRDSPAPASQWRSALAQERASPQVRHVAQWARDSRDHAGLPFVVVDKATARLFAFDGDGALRASAPVLLGSEVGDVAQPPYTPAGRFVIDSWQSASSGGIVWVNDGAAVALHGLPSAASPGRAQQRLASGRVQDKRISDGSLHVAGDFYRTFLAPLRGHASVAYVLPEARPAQEMFGSPARESDQRLAQRPPSTSRRPS